LEFVEEFKIPEFAEL